MSQEKEYATVQINSGQVYRVDVGAPNGSGLAGQFDGLRGHTLVVALNKLAELGYTPLAGAIDHGEINPTGAQYTVILSRDK